MLAKLFALMLTVTIGALALEMVLGVHLGIEAQVRRVFDAGGIRLMLR